MISKLAPGLAMACICVPAMADSGFYAGAAVGRLTLKDSVSGVNIKATTDTGYKLFGGYRFNEFGSIEAAYLAGTPEDSISGVTIKSDASAFQASALWQVPISNRFEAYVRFSVVAWEADNSASDGQITFTQNNDGTDLGLGIGAAFNVTPWFGLRAEFEGAEFEGTDMRALSVAGLLRF